MWVLTINIKFMQVNKIRDKVTGTALLRRLTQQNNLFSKRRKGV